jgi:hypothetical protein
MDVYVQRTGMIRMALDCSLQCGAGLCDAGLRLAVFCPVIPGARVHDGVSVEHGNIGIVGEAAVHSAHFGCIRLVERFAIRRLGAEARRQSINERLFPVVGFTALRHCLSDRVVALLLAIRTDSRVVDVRR